MDLPQIIYTAHGIPTGSRSSSPSRSSPRASQGRHGWLLCNSCLSLGSLVTSSLGVWSDMAQQCAQPWGTPHVRGTHHGSADSFADTGKGLAQLQSMRCSQA